MLCIAISQVVLTLKEDMATLRGWLTGIGRAAQNRIAPSSNAISQMGSSGVVGVPTSSRRPIVRGFYFSLGNKCDLNLIQIVCNRVVFEGH